MSRRGVMRSLRSLPYPRMRVRIRPATGSGQVKIFEKTLKMRGRPSGRPLTSPRAPGRESRCELERREVAAVRAEVDGGRADDFSDLDVVDRARRTVGAPVVVAEVVPEVVAEVVAQVVARIVGGVIGAVAGRDAQLRVVPGRVVAGVAGLAVVARGVLAPHVRVPVDRASERRAAEEPEDQVRTVELGHLAGALVAVLDAVVVGVRVDRVVAGLVLTGVVEAVAVGVLLAVLATVAVAVGTTRVRALADLVAVVDAVAVGILVRVGHAVAVAVGLARVGAGEELALVGEAVLVRVLLGPANVVALGPLGHAHVVVAASLGVRAGGQREHEERGDRESEQAETAEDLGHDPSHRASNAGPFAVGVRTGRPFDPGTLGRVSLRRLHPDPREVPAEEVTTGLRFGDLAPPDRPYLVLNMVETLDGRIAIDGRSGSIGNQADREIFHGLRTQADAVMVGAGTVRAERYGRMTKNDELRARREREGLAPDALAVVVSGRLNLPPDLPLLQDPGSHVLVLTATDGEPPDVPARVDVLRGEPAPDAGVVLGPLLRRLREEHGVRSILCEGGPALNHGLLRERLVDELFLALAPKLAAGEPLTVVTGDGLRPTAELDLISVLESEGNLFMRYRV